MLAHHRRDPDAVAFSSTAAAEYADEVEKLGVAAQVIPTETLAYGTDRGQRLDIYAPPMTGTYRFLCSSTAARG